MNPREKGYRRDKEILFAVEEYRVLDTEQVWMKFFKDIPTGKRKAQERLLKLYQAGKLRRARTDEGLFAYFHHKQKLQAHTIGINWARIWLNASCRPWESPQSFAYEQRYPTIRPDGFEAVRNSVTGSFKFWFVEFDNATNPFDKVKKYNQLYESKGYADKWWAKLAARFPPVLVVTTSPGRMANILTKVEQENTAGIEFQVRLLEDIKKEVMSNAMASSPPTIATP